MGWTGFYSAPKHEQERIVNMFKKQGEYIDSKVTNYGKHLWIAFKIAPLANGPERSVIALYLFKNGGQGEWLYKDMDEGQGFGPTDCPISLLKKTTGDGSKNSLEWRQEVLNAKEFKTEIATMRDGTVVEVFGIYYQIFHKVSHYTQTITKSIYGKRLDTGNIYRIRPSQISRIVSNKEQYFLEEEKHEQSNGVGGN